MSSIKEIGSISYVKWNLLFRMKDINAMLLNYGTKTKKSNIAVRLNFAPLQGLEPWTL